MCMYECVCVCVWGLIDRKSGASHHHCKLLTMECVCVLCVNANSGVDRGRDRERESSSCRMPNSLAQSRISAPHLRIFGRTCPSPRSQDAYNFFAYTNYVCKYP